MVSPAPNMNGTVFIPQRESFMGKVIAFTLGFVAGAAALGTVAYLCRDDSSVADEEDGDELPEPANEWFGHIHGRVKRGQPSAAEDTPDSPKEKTETSQTDANDSVESDAAGATA